MCRSIKPLRTTTGPASDEEILAAALQLVRKVSGFRTPSRTNEDAFGAAVADIAASTPRLLPSLPPKKETPARN